MNIIIIGCGWYGCHIASKLKDKFNIIMIDQKSDIFDNSSYYNQNRVHQGYHYPRDFATRNLCSRYYNRFKNEYNEVIDSIDNNYYLISKSSIIDYGTYKSIYENELFDFKIIDNYMFNNIYSKIIIVNEENINSDKIKKYFLEVLLDIKKYFNKKVLSYIKIDNKIQVICEDATYTCDILLDCTYNQLNLSKKEYNYELTISLVYKKINDTIFDALTVMDGKFFSLYPRNIYNQTFTLTDVEFTPIISSQDYNIIDNYKPTLDEINIIKLKMENKVISYYDSFKDNFEYESYFLSKKTKMLSATDSRDITIDEIEENVISVNCGKIYGIYDFEDFIMKYLNIAE
jgi:hypothetical protein